MTAVATRMSARLGKRRLFSTSGKPLGEEEKAAENVYIKKMEKERLEKLAKEQLAKQGVAKAAEHPPTTPGGASTDVKPSVSPGSSTAGVSTDKNRNYAVLAGTVAAVSALGWYLLSKPKKTEDIAD